MKIEGKIKKSGKWWAVEVPLLLVFTQGKTKKSAFLLIKEAIEELIDVKGFEVYIDNIQADTFSVATNNTRRLMAFILKQQRSYYKKSIRQVAAKLGSDSPTAYSRYEQAKTGLNMDKFTQILAAINEESEPVLKIVSKAVS